MQANNFGGYKQPLEKGCLHQIAPYQRIHEHTSAAEQQSSLANSLMKAGLKLLLENQDLSLGFGKLIMGCLTRAAYYNICIMQVSTRQEVLELVRAITVDVWLCNELVDLRVPIHPAFAHLQGLQLA